MKKFKRISAILLSLLMTVSTLPAAAAAQTAPVKAVSAVAKQETKAEVGAKAESALGSLYDSITTVVKVYTWDELKAALEQKGDVKILLMQDITDKTIDRPGSYTDQYLHYGATISSGTKVFDFNNHNLWINMNYQTSWAWSSVKDKYEHANESLFYITSGALLGVCGKGRLFFDGWVKADADYHMDVRNIFEVNGGMLNIDDGEFDIGHLSAKHSDSKESSFYYCVHGSSVYLRNGIVQINGGTFNGRGYAMPYGKYNENMSSNYVNLYNNHNAAVYATGGLLYINDGLFYGQDAADSVGVYSGCMAYLYGGVYNHDTGKDYIRIKHGDFSRWRNSTFHYDTGTVKDVHGRGVDANGIASTIANVCDTIKRVIIKPNNEISYQANMTSRTDGQSQTAGVGCTYSNPIVWEDTSATDLTLPIKASVYETEYYKIDRSDGKGAHTVRFYAEFRNDAGSLIETLDMGTAGSEFKITRSMLKNSTALSNAAKYGRILLVTIRSSEYWKSTNEYTFKTYTGSTTSGGYGSLYLKFPPQITGTVTCGDHLKNGNTVWYIGESYSITTTDAPTTGLTYTLQQYDTSSATWSDVKTYLKNFNLTNDCYGKTVRFKVTAKDYGGAIYSDSGKVLAKIAQISATITEPVSGQKPNTKGTLNAIVNTEGAYPSMIATDNVTVRWYDITGEAKLLSGTDTFVAGRKYNAYITADLQYKISNSVRLQLNSYASTLTALKVDNYSNDVQFAHYASFNKEFTCGGYVSEVRCNISEPNSGDTPSMMTISPGDPSKYSATIDYWYTLDANQNKDILGPSAKFLADKTYYAAVIITPKSSLYFDGKTKCYINSSLMGTAYVASTSMYVNPSFKTPADTVINEVRCLVWEPKAGDTPTRVPTIASGVNYTASIDYWYLEDAAAGNPTLKSTDKFEAGKYYCVRIAVHSKQGYCFTKDTKKYINSNEARLYGSGFDSNGNSNSNFIGIQYTFYVPATGSNTYLVGDVNNDGKVNGADAGLLNRYTSGWSNVQIKNMDAADVNRDGKVNGADAGILNRYTSGWQGYDKYIKTVTD